MKQSDLNRAVASSLGESVSTIAGRGFSLIYDAIEEREPLVLDFDNDAQPALLPTVAPAS